MVEAIEHCAAAEGIQFSASWAQLRCMLHTIHLAAIKLLEAIGALSKADAEKAASCSGNYQDAITAPLSCVHDNDAEGLTDGNQLTDVDPDLLPNSSGNIFSAVDKVCLTGSLYHIRTMTYTLL